MEQLRLTNMLFISSEADIHNDELPIARTLSDNIVMTAAAPGIGK
jgi:hypothetical protein